MLTFSGSVRVFLAVEPADMRKGMEGLHALLAERLVEDIKSGALFVFINKRHTRLNVLYFDGTGLWLAAKRLEEGAFNRPFYDDGFARSSGSKRWRRKIPSSRSWWPTCRWTKRC